jgi:sensor histidine kinase YesM
MKKIGNTLLYYFLFIAVCLLINYISRERLAQVNLTIAIRDFVLLSILFIPTCLGGYYLVQYLNNRKIISKSFFNRIVRDFLLAIVISLITVTILYGIRFFFFNSTKVEDVLVKYVSVFLVNITIIQFIEFYFYFIESKNKAIKLEREKNKLLEIQYQTLREQINPHFLFNTLNTLSSLIFDDQEKANQYTKSLAKLYRYILSTNQEVKVPLEKELKFLKSYFFIQKLRFLDTLELEVKKTIYSSTEFFIVPLTLQILVENAIKHNIHNAESPLKIDILIDDHKIIVSNKKYIKNTKENSTRKGLAYIQALYETQNKEVLIFDKKEEFIVSIPHLKPVK